MLQLSQAALFYYFFIFFTFPPQCKAFFLRVNHPTPAQGSDLFPGRGFTLRWSGGSDHFSTMNIELRDSDNQKLRKKWDSIVILSKSLSDTLPDIPSGKYYFWCGDSEHDDQFGDSGDFFVTLVPVTVTNPVTTTATTSSTTFMSDLPMPPTPAGPSQPSQLSPLALPPTSSGPISASGVINTGSVVTAAMSKGPTDGASNSQPNSSVISPSDSSSTASMAMARSNHTPTGAIVGGALGGMVILFAIFAFIIIHRRSNLKELRTYIPTVSGANIPRVTRYERTLQKVLATAPGEQQRITSHLERGVAEHCRNDSSPSNTDEETQRLTNQIAIMTARIQQLETQERGRQDTVVGLTSPPPMYSSGQQSPVNQGAAAFVI